MGGAVTVEVPLGAATLSVAEAGRGGRPLLLVHGFTGAKEDFADWMDAFAADGWWVVAPDLRGHGSSSQPAGEEAYDLATFSADLLALADHLGWDRFALLGHSMGGMIAQELVLDHPGRVERLVLMDTHHGPPEAFDRATVELGVALLRAEGLPALVAMIDELVAGNRSATEERMRATRPGYVEANERKVHACSPEMYASMALGLTSRPDRLAELATLAVPTRVVVGEHDVDFLAASHRLAEAIPGADLVVIPDGAHSPQVESPEAWWRAVAPWLAGSLVAEASGPA